MRQSGRYSSKKLHKDFRKFDRILSKIMYYEKKHKVELLIEKINIIINITYYCPLVVSMQKYRDIQFCELSFFHLFCFSDKRQFTETRN